MRQSTAIPLALCSIFIILYGVSVDLFIPFPNLPCSLLPNEYVCSCVSIQLVYYILVNDHNIMHLLHQWYFSSLFIFITTGNHSLLISNAISGSTNVGSDVVSFKISFKESHD
eukprot:335112_1